MTTPDGYLMGQDTAFGMAGWARGLEADLLEVEHPRKNRPSVVLAALGYAPGYRIAALAAAEREKYGTGSDPILDRRILRAPPPTSTRGASLELTIEAERSWRIHAFVNGVPVFTQGGKPIDKDGPAKITLPLAPGDNRVVLYGKRPDGAQTRADSFVITAEGDTSIPATIYFLGIGVASYQDATRNLAYPIDDVRAAARAFEKLYRGRAKTLLLTDAGAKREAIRGARSFLEKAQTEDTVVVYLAGHGLLGASGEYVFATVDTNFSEPEGRGLRFADLEALLDGLAAGNKLAFIDSCHSGTRTGGGWTVVDDTSPAGVIMVRGAQALVPPKLGADPDEGLHAVVAGLAGDLRRGTGTTIVAAASAEELAVESSSVKNGLFTHVLLRVLREGIGRRTDGTLWIADIVDAVSREVVMLSRGVQRPQVRQGSPGNRRPLVSAQAEPIYRSAVGAATRWDVASSPDGRSVVVAGDGGIERISLTERRALGARTPWPFDRKTGCEKLCHLDLDNAGGLRLRAGSHAYVLDARANVMRRLDLELEVHRLVASNDGRWLAHCRNDGVAVFDVRAMKPSPLLRDIDCNFTLAWMSDVRRFRTTEVQIRLGDDVRLFSTVVDIDPQSGAVSRQSGPSMGTGHWLGQSELSIDGRVLFFEETRSQEAVPPESLGTIVRTVRAFDLETSSELDLTGKGRVFWVNDTRFGQAPTISERIGSTLDFAVVYRDLAAASFDLLPFLDATSAPVIVGGYGLVVPSQRPMKPATKNHRHYDVVDLRTRTVVDWFALPAGVPFAAVGETVYALEADGTIVRIDLGSAPRR